MAASNPDAQPEPRLSIDERATRVLERAKELAGRVESGAEFSHAVFDPQDGLAARAFPTLRERREFTLTKPYAEIYDILRGLMVRFAAASGARPQLSHEQGVRMQRQVAQEKGQERFS
jgi:hypothetical protein